MDKLLRYIKAYTLILGMSLRSRMSFRLDFFVMLASVFLREFASLSLLIVVVQRFDNLAGWSTWEMAFLYCVVTFTHRNFASFTGGILSIGELVKTGEMDAYMLTPLSPLFLVNSRNTMVWRMFYNIGILLLLIYCGYRAGIVFSLANTLLFLVMMLSSMLILVAVYLTVSTLAIFTVEVGAAVQTIDELTRKYMIYPIGIYGTIPAFILTFVLPLGFVAYYPASFLLDKAQEIMFSPLLGVLSPVFALLAMALALGLWRLGVKNYKSTGT